MLHGRCVVCIPGFSCLDLESPIFLFLLMIRGNTFWQWTMLSVNLINVTCLMLGETDEVNKFSNMASRNIRPNRADRDDHRADRDDRIEMIR